jgi:putative oxidoreductase
MALDSFLAGWGPRLLSVLRIITAFLFIPHGDAKLFNFLGAPNWKGAAAAFTIPWVAGVLEFFGGLLLLVGLFTRPVAFILSGLMAVAYFMAHAPQGFWPYVNKGELAVLYCFVFLYLAAAGPGPWSIDHMLSRGRRT